MVVEGKKRRHQLPINLPLPAQQPAHGPTHVCFLLTCHFDQTDIDATTAMDLRVVYATRRPNTPFGHTMRCSSKLPATHTENARRALLERRVFRLEGLHLQPVRMLRSCMLIPLKLLLVY